MSALGRVARLGAIARWRLGIAVAAGTGAALCAVGLAAVSAWLIARAAEQPPVLYLLTAVTAVRAFGIGRGVLRYAERLTAHDAAFRVLTELRATTYARLARLAPAGLAELRSGDLLARLVGDIDTLADLWLRVLLPAGGIALVAVVTILVLFAMVPAAAIVVAVTLLLTAIGAPAAVARFGRHAERRLAPLRGDLLATSLELVRGGPELLAADATAAALEGAARLDRRLGEMERRLALGAGLGGLVAGIAAGVAVWASLVVGIVAVGDGSLPGVLLAVVALTPIAIHEVAAPLVPAAGRLPGIAHAATRVLEVVQRPDPVAEPASSAELPAGALGLRAERLRVRYPGTDRDALGPVDLVVMAGECAVLTGSSGSGKSTLVNACLRFLDPADGRLLVSGAGEEQDLAAVAGDVARRSIGACLQDPHVFDSTLEANLRIARPEASAADLEAALRDAQLLDWVRGLPQGLATPVGEHGARLSGGQRQRLALAQALLGNARLVLFDEPTEHLDEAAARALVDDLAALAPARTVLVLTHRPDLFERAPWRMAGQLPSRS